MLEKYLYNKCVEALTLQSSFWVLSILQTVPYLETQWIVLRFAGIKQWRAGPREEAPGSDLLETGLQILEDLGQSGILHRLGSHPRWLELPHPPQVASQAPYVRLDE